MILPPGGRYGVFALVVVVVGDKPVAPPKNGQKEINSLLITVCALASQSEKHNSHFWAHGQPTTLLDYIYITEKPSVAGLLLTAGEQRTLLGEFFFWGFYSDKTFPLIIC